MRCYGRITPAVAHPDHLSRVNTTSSVLTMIGATSVIRVSKEFLRTLIHVFRAPFTFVVRCVQFLFFFPS